MKRYKYHIITGILVISAILGGCMDELVAPDNNINGVIYDRLGFIKRDFSGTIIISAGDYPITYSFMTPYFSLNSISKPYNIHVYSPYDSGFAMQPSIMKYTGITTNNIKIVEYDYYQREDIYNEIQCIVKFPALETEKVIYFKFVSQEHFKQYYFSTVGSKGVDNVSFRIYIANNSSYINGRIYYIEATRDSYNRLTSYDKFGSRELTLELGQYEEIIFSSNDISYNPPEKISNVSVTFPLNTFSRRTSVGLGTPDLNKPSEMDFYVTGESDFGAVVPVLPGNDFKIRIISSYMAQGFAPFSEEAEKWVYLNPGENAEIVHDNTIQIISPPENSPNVNVNTVFEINDNSENGVYIWDIYRFTEDFRCIRFITTQKKIKFADFLIRGFEYFPSERYRWNVKKYLGYNSMDEFLSSVYIMDKKFSVLSETREFTTEP